MVDCKDTRRNEINVNHLELIGQEYKRRSYGEDTSRNRFDLAFCFFMK